MVDLRRQIVLVRRHLLLLVLSVLVGAVAGFGLTSLQHRTYEAKATLIVGQSLAANANYDQILASQRLSATYAAIAVTRPVLQQTITQLNLGLTVDQLLQRVRADAASDSSLVTISVQDEDPGRAAAIANAIGGQLVAESPTIQGREAALQKGIDDNLAATEAEIATVSAQIDTLSKVSPRTAAQDAQLVQLHDRLASLRSFYAAILPYSSADSSNALTVVDPATVPTDPISPSRWLNVAIGALLGLLIAAGFASVGEYLDDTVKDADGVAATAGMSMIATIPLVRPERGRHPIKSLTALLHPRSRAAEAFRTLRTNLGFASIDRKFRTLLITSSLPDEGKTEIAANLAVTYAESGKRVLLVDCDLRKPALHTIFDLQNTDGVTTLLLNDDALIDRVAQFTELENLRVVTSGPIPPNPLELVGSERMRFVIDRLKAAADVVIVDSPPLALVTDAAILSSYIDGTLFVIAAGRTHSRAITQSCEALKRAGAKVLGAVLNRYQPEHGRQFSDYYGDYPPRDQHDDESLVAARGSVFRGR